MKFKREHRGQWLEARRRVAVLAVVISCHLALLMLVLGPAIRDKDVTPAMENNPDAIKLRFFRFRTLPLASATAPPPGHSVLALSVHPKISKKPAQSLTAQRVAPVATSTQETPRTSPLSANDATAGDGGFLQRLLEARPSYGRPRLPGSDSPVVAGIELADPMSQGVGAVMRSTQRLFGIKNSHCIDVDTWRSLTPQELSARHVSLSDVDRTDEKYACNAPPGLHF